MAKAKVKAKTRQQIGFRMRQSFIDKLDALCQANLRTRRDIVELLVEQAHAAWAEDNSARIDPT